jgi:hypothetical protein
MFRVSTDGDDIQQIINLSNSTNPDAVTWWERNATNNISVMRIGTDNVRHLEKNNAIS